MQWLNLLRIVLIYLRLAVATCNLHAQLTTSFFPGQWLCNTILWSRS